MNQTMLKFLLFLAFLPALSFGQDLCEGFENPICQNDPLFFNECIEGWISTNGTPNLNEGNIDPFAGENYAALSILYNGVCDNPTRGEGIALEYNFEAGVTYELSYAIRGTDAINSPEVIRNREWILTNGLENTSNGVSTCDEDGTTPEIPIGSVVFPTQSFELNSWTVRTEFFQLSSNFSQLWFRATDDYKNKDPFFQQATSVYLDDICIRIVCENVKCEETTDLTACEEEGDYGFISLNCGDVSYDWTLPAGSSAIEVDGANSSNIIQASEGIYTVTITDSLGCTTVQEFEIIADCCASTASCETPDNPVCTFNDGSVTLSWDAAPEAQYYILSLTYSDSACGCTSPNGNTSTNDINVYTGTSYTFSVPSFACFSWSVKSVCKDGTFSESSAPKCFTPEARCNAGAAGKSGGRFIESSNNSVQTHLSPSIYPNPSSGSFNFELQAPDHLTLSVEVYSLEGRLVKSFGEEHYADGFYKKTWLAENHLSNGIYYVFFKTNFGTFQEKVVISKSTK